MTAETIQRTCANCGQRKPRSAFLFLDEKGLQESIFCNECRGESRKRRLSKEDDVGSGESKLRIGARELVQIKNRQQQAKEEKKITEHSEKELKFHEQKTQEKLSEKQDDEKQLLYQLLVKPYSTEEKFVSKEEKKQRDFQERIEEQKQILRQQKENELKEAKIQSNTSSFTPLQTHTISRDNEVIRNLFTLLGSSAPGAKTILGEKRASEKNIPSADYTSRPISTLFNKTTDSGEKLEKENNKETAEEFIKRRWGPKSP